MTFWAKLLIVVIFVLSLIFAAMSAVLFGKRENFRAELDKTKREYAQAKDDWTQKNADLTARLNHAVDEIRQATSDAEAAQLRVNTLTDEGTRKDADLRALKLADDKDKNLNLEQATALSSLGTQVQALLAGSEKLKADNNALNTELSAERSRSNKLEKENTDLTASLKTTTDAKDKAESTIKMNDEIFAELSRRNVAWRELITQWTTLPDIKTTVLSVDKESNFVLLNAGLKQGVMKNYEFSIFRDSLFVAKVNVFDVQDNMCAARITVPKLAIQKGDNAWTRLAND